MHPHGTKGQKRKESTTGRSYLILNSVVIMNLDCVGEYMLVFLTSALKKDSRI
jgi:hypothetical protein